MEIRFARRSAGAVVAMWGAVPAHAVPDARMSAVWPFVRGMFARAVVAIPVAISFVPEETLAAMVARMSAVSLFAPRMRCAMWTAGEIHATLSVFASLTVRLRRAIRFAAVTHAGLAVRHSAIR